MEMEELQKNIEEINELKNQIDAQIEGKKLFEAWLATASCILDKIEELPNDREKNWKAQLIIKYYSAVFKDTIPLHCYVNSKDVLSDIKNFKVEIIKHIAMKEVKIEEAQDKLNKLQEALLDK